MGIFQPAMLVYQRVSQFNIPGNSAGDLSSRGLNSKVVGDLQRLGIKRSRIESPGVDTTN